MRYFIKTIKHSIMNGDIIAHDSNDIMSNSFPSSIDDLILSESLKQTMDDIFIFCDNRNQIRRINRDRRNPIPKVSNFVKTINIKIIKYKIEDRKFKLNKIC